jgi:hypothetical protein
MSEAKIIPAREIPADILDTLRGEAAGHPAVYPTQLQQHFRNSRIAAGLLRVAEIVEPVDRMLGIDRKMPATRAFRVGSLLGLRVVSECVDWVDEAFSDGVALMPAINSEDEDKLQLRHEFGCAIIQMGQEGYAKVKDTFDPLFDDWEDALESQVQYQPYLRSGFGVPILYLYRRYELNQEAVLATMEAAAAGGVVDWDAELRKIAP